MCIWLFHHKFIELYPLRNLQVPQEIHNEWKQGGASRTRLQELFASLNFDKAR